MSSRLERRYRALLKVLPRWYRAEREEEMVASFLDSRPDDDLDPEYGWPGWAEAGATVALALRTRMDRPIGASIRLLGLFGLVLGVSISAASLVFGADRSPLWLLVNLASAAALVAAVRGAALETRVLAAIPVVVGSVPLVMSSHPVEALMATVFLLPAAVTLLALCASRPKASPRWLWAGAGAAVLGVTVPFAGINPTFFAPVALTIVALLARRREWTVTTLIAICVVSPATIIMAPLAEWPIFTLGVALTVTALRLFLTPRQPLNTPTTH